jgi:O-methyltransferase involved in polyketide biosynthesis
MAEPLIQNVSDTAFTVAVYRAMESERPDALFHDPLARKLTGEHGQRIVNDMSGGFFRGRELFCARGWWGGRWRSAPASSIRLKARAQSP